MACVYFRGIEMTQVVATTSQQAPLHAFASKYVRYSDLVDALKVSRVTIYRWTLLPDFPKPIKRGNTVLFNAELVDEWLNSVEA